MQIRQRRRSPEDSIAARVRKARETEALIADIQYKTNLAKAELGRELSMESWNGDSGNAAYNDDEWGDTAPLPTITSKSGNPAIQKAVVLPYGNPGSRTVHRRVDLEGCGGEGDALLRLGVRKLTAEYAALHDYDSRGYPGDLKILAYLVGPDWVSFWFSVPPALIDPAKFNGMLPSINGIEINPAAKFVQGAERSEMKDAWIQAVNDAEAQHISSAKPSNVGPGFFVGSLCLLSGGIAAFHIFPALIGWPLLMLSSIGIIVFGTRVIRHGMDSIIASALNQSRARQRIAANPSWQTAIKAVKLHAMDRLDDLQRAGERLTAVNRAVDGILDQTAIEESVRLRNRADELIRIYAKPAAIASPGELATITRDLADSLIQIGDAADELRKRLFAESLNDFSTQRRLIETTFPSPSPLSPIAD